LGILGNRKQEAGSRKQETVAITAVSCFNLFYTLKHKTIFSHKLQKKECSYFYNVPLFEERGTILSKNSFISLRFQAIDKFRNTVI